jgi:hypothetical protein
MKNTRSQQRGGMLSLLLALLVIGLLAYFALRSHNVSPSGTGDQPQLPGCTKLAGDLVRRTGGIGPDYKAGYEALPPGCRDILPPPAAAASGTPGSQGE